MPQCGFEGHTYNGCVRELFDRTPLCVNCGSKAGRVTVATIRDHIVPLTQGGDESGIELPKHYVSRATKRNDATEVSHGMKKWGRI